MTTYLERLGQIFISGEEKSKSTIIKHYYAETKPW